MPSVPALARFRKLIDDISRLYVDARRAQVRFGWPAGSLREETGRRIVEEEQDGAMRAQYGTGLLLQLSKTLSEKYGAGFSKSNLLKMRRFYLLNQKESVTTQLDWTDYVELLLVKDEKTRQRLEQCILREDLNSSQTGHSGSVPAQQIWAESLRYGPVMIECLHETYRYRRQQDQQRERAPV